MFRKRIKWALGLALVMTFVIMGVVLAATTVIDHFDELQELELVCSDPLPAPVVDSVTPANVLGNERDVIAQILTCSSGRLFVNVNLDGDSLYDYSSDSNVQGYSEIQWDGVADVNKEDIDYIGLRNGGPTGEDLTEGGLINRFIIGVSSNDLESFLRFRVYTDENNWSEGTIILPSGISFYNPQVFEILFSNFTAGDTAAGPAVFTNVGAIVMQLYGAQPSLDTTLHLISTADEDYLDFGDLPNSFDTELTPGPRNIIHGPVLGPVATNISAEGDGQPDNPDADLDEYDDGVVPSPGVQWTVAAGGSINVTVSNCPTANCYLSAWIDWNQDGNFYDIEPPYSIYQPDPGEKILGDYPVVNGTNNDIPFPIPSGTDIADGLNNSYFHARFRIHEYSSGGLSIPSWAMFSGETEDFYLGFWPNAVTLTSVEANTNYAVPFALLAGALVLLVSGGAILAFKRRRA